MLSHHQKQFNSTKSPESWWHAIAHFLPGMHSGSRRLHKSFAAGPDMLEMFFLAGY